MVTLGGNAKITYSIEDSPSASLQYAAICLEFSIATMSTLQRSCQRITMSPMMTKVYIRLQRQSLKQLGPLGWLSRFFLSLSFRISLKIQG